MSDLASDPDIVRIETFCRNVVGAAGKLIDWEWDHKFLLMIGVLDLERGETVREILEGNGMREDEDEDEDEKDEADEG